MFDIFNTIALYFRESCGDVGRLLASVVVDDVVIVAPVKFEPLTTNDFLFNLSSRLLQSLFNVDDIVVLVVVLLLVADVIVDPVVVAVSLKNGSLISKHELNRSLTPAAYTFGFAPNIFLTQRKCERAVNGFDFTPL